MFEHSKLNTIIFSEQSWEVHVRDCRLDCADEQENAGLKGGESVSPGTPPDVALEAVPDDEVEAVDPIDPEEATTENNALAEALIGAIEPHPYLCFSNET